MTPQPTEDIFTTPARFVGVITPSGNTVVERVTTAILREFAGVFPLFSRTPVFGNSDPFPGHYDMNGMMGAATLLAHARPDVLVWNGSKGGKIGIEHDREFAALAAAETGIRSTTSIMALDDVLRRNKLMRVAIVTPYDDTYQHTLVETYRKAGFDVVGESHMRLTDNLSFASLPVDMIERAIREAAASKPDAVLALCTNFPAATVMPAIEADTGIPMFDSASIGVWAALNLMGIDTSPAHRWGRLFAEPGFGAGQTPR